MADDHKQLILFGQALPGSDQALLERIQDSANYRNRNGSIPTKALEEIAADDIRQIAVGHNHVAFLFKDHRIARLAFDITEIKVEPPCGVVEKSGSGGSTSSSGAATIPMPTDTSVPPPIAPGSSSATAAGNGSSAAASYAAAANAAASRTAKIRRVMMAARRPGGFCGRAGVIVDRARPLVPASSIPEELIAQAQVVLQGKSREVIVRELQRTNLNVNEAVNNLLSRDDDEADDLDDSSEAYLHEELLSLLDAGLRTDGGAAIIDHDSIYASSDGYEYLVARDLARRRDGGRADLKPKERGRDPAEPQDVFTEQLTFAETLEYWPDKFPPGVTKFLKIAATHSELLTIADDGKLYSWSWDRKAKPSNTPHPVNAFFFAESKDEKIIDIESCAWRAVVLTDRLRVGSFMDIACGQKVGHQFFEPLAELPDGESPERLHVCPLFAAVQTTNGCIYWWGIYPYNERRKLWERARSRSRKHVTFDTNEITVGSEVRTKSNPIYSAGSIAINFTSGVPMVGILQEHAWTLNETCRFRVQTPEQYDVSTGEGGDSESEKKVSVNHGTSASGGGGTGSSASISAPPVKEAAWPLKETIFIREETVNDTGIVKIIDGAYCGIVYKSTLEKVGDGGDGANLTNLRLMRKDDLVAISPQAKTPRSPENHQHEFQSVHLPSSVRRVIAMAVDCTGFRVLVEKRNRAHLLRISCLGKLLSDHMLPLNLHTLCENVGRIDGKPTLENYGDEGLLLLRDATGNIVPLLRNAAGGYREPPYVGFSRLQDLSIGLRYPKLGAELSSGVLTSSPLLNPPSTKPAPNKNANRLAIIAALVAPSAELQPKVPSLMQNILFCDLGDVRKTLAALEHADRAVRISTIVDARADGNRNILHAAAMNAFATTNRDQADADEEAKPTATTKRESEVDSEKATFEKLWNETLETKEDPKGAITVGRPVGNKDRQRNAIEIIRELAAHPAVKPYFQELIEEKDINGQTPLMCAVQMRAYSAANILWRATLQNCKPRSTVKIEKDEESTLELQNELALPPGSKPDDSPLFVVCYNDTCSFTWTGDEHINQDIFECKTCGLTGTLCCCSECAYTCHRNHDCKLKRTSPTAYCDCWEKCSCKALVSGNQVQRELLLIQLIKNTTLIQMLNGRGEHLLLFLARTVGRQLSEQENFIRRISKLRSQQQATGTPADQNVPEHDLDPPKFARKAFERLMGDWSAVRSLLKVGVKDTAEDAVIIEEVFHLGQQHGSTHLDKFTFTLLAKCQESHLDVLLNTLIRQANLTGNNRDADVDTFISRFVRSVIRLFVFITVLSPAAAGITIQAIATNLMSDASVASKKLATSNTGNSGSSSKSAMSNYRAVSISGMLSLVRTSLPVGILPAAAPKDNKKKAINAFVMKCRRIFQALVSYSLNELLNASDALMAPVRLGVVKPTSMVSRTLSSNADILEVMERYLNTEQDLTTLLASSEESQGGKSVKRKRYGSRRDTDDESAMEVDRTRRADATMDSDESESDSDGDGDRSTRRLDSQGSVGGPAEEAPPAPVRGPRTANYERSRPAALAFDGDDSTDSLSSPSEDDGDSEDEESNDGYDEDEFGTRRIRLVDDDTGENDDDDEEEDQYGFHLDEEDEEEGESGADEGSGEHEYYSSDDESEVLEGIFVDDSSSRTDNEPEAAPSDSDRAEGDNSASGGSAPVATARRKPGRSAAAAAAPPTATRGRRRGRRGRSGSRSGAGDEPRQPEPSANEGGQPASGEAPLASGESVESNNELEVSIPQEERNADSVVVLVNPSDVGIVEQPPESNDSNASTVADSEVDVEPMDTSEPRQEAPAALRPTARRTARMTSRGGMAPRGTVILASSLSSSLNNNEGAAATTGTRIGSRTNSQSGGYPGSVRVSTGHGTAPPLTWAVRGVRQQNDNGGTYREEAGDGVAITDVAATERSGTTATDASGNPSGASRHRTKEPIATNDDHHASTNKTDTQLAICYSVMVKLVDELLLQMAQHEQWRQSAQAGITTLLYLDKRLVHGFRRLIEQRLQSVWDWLQVVMDKTEAQLKFGNALMASSVGSLVVPESSGETTPTETPAPAKKTTDDKRSRKRMEFGLKRITTDDNSSRRDTFSYFLSLLRSHSSENGDDLPLIEYKALRAVAFVAEAYLFHINILENIDEILVDEEEDIRMMDEEEYDVKISAEPLRRFYQRSNSICYPFISTADGHHAFQYTADQCLPLSTRTHLLKPETERFQLFSLPVPHRTKRQHKEIAADHGVEHPAHQSLSVPPTNYVDVASESDKSKSTTPSAEDAQKEQSSSQRPNVIVHSSDASASAGGSAAEKPDVEALLGVKTSVARVLLQRVLGRWSNTLLLMSKAYHEDITSYCGGDAACSVLLSETAGYHVRQAQFRKRMEKFKSAQTKDLTFSQMSREKSALLTQTFRQLNQQYARRSASTSNAATSDSTANPPLAAHKVKVTFRDEPGEGTGVARSFYSAVADALVGMTRLPTDYGPTNEDGTTSGGNAPSNDYTSSRSPASALNIFSRMRRHGDNSMPPTAGSVSSRARAGGAGSAAASLDDRIRTRSQRATNPAAVASAATGSASATSTTSSSSRRTPQKAVAHKTPMTRFNLPLDAPPYVPKAGDPWPVMSTSAPASSEAGAISPNVLRASEPPLGAPDASGPRSRQAETNSMLLGERVYARVCSIQPQYAAKITGMIVNGLQLSQQFTLLSSDENFRIHVEEAAAQLRKTGYNGKESEKAAKDNETVPLFYKASKSGFYTPIPGSNSPQRLNAFRNVGRLIGICLQQMEIFPMHVCRHVLKFILDRQITWFDLAFYDPAIFDSLRSIVFNEAENVTHSNEFYESLQLTFAVDMPPEEGGGTLELKPGGENIPVTKDNVLEYIYLFVEHRLLGSHLKCLEAIRQGVYDVIPPDSLANLTAEDIRLILCGTQDISLPLLQSYTSFLDESSASSEILAKFKQWFWSVASKFTAAEKQDLVFFWTGSPTLPSTEEGFQPLPTIMIRPADDNHLPTANTCISRLYLPLYSSKKILRAKLLLAIKARNFGFV